MSSINKVLLYGRLGRDPELRYTTAGRAIANLSLATDESWTDKEGQKQKRTEWHKVVVYGRQAETCGQYLTKGQSVFVEGALQTRSYMTKENEKRYTTEVVGSRVIFTSAPKQEKLTESDFEQVDFAPSEPTTGEEVDLPF